MLERGELWIVLIEADGVQMPSVFYRRRDQLAMRVRGGDRELGPLARRDEGGGGVIFQEGAVICASESLARQMAFLAIDTFDEMEPEQLEGRHPVVSIGRVKLSRHITRNRQDVEVIERIESILGKRGRRPDPVLWAVTCTECGQVNPVEHWRPVNCPNCHGLLIHSRRGKVVAYQDPAGDVLEAWLRTRFAGPHWEPAPVSDSGRVPPPFDRSRLPGREEETLSKLEASPVLDLIRRMPRDAAFEYLDAMLAVRTYRTRESRLEARVATATEFFRQGGTPMGISLTEPPHLDLVDAAPVLGNEAVVAWMLSDQD